MNESRLYLFLCFNRHALFMAFFVEQSQTNATFPSCSDQVTQT